MKNSYPTPFFHHRQIAVTFFVQNPDGTQDIIKIKDKFAIKAEINILGNHNGTVLALDIYGLPQDLINRLSFISDFTTKENSQTITTSKTRILIEAGTYNTPLTPIFTGLIGKAHIDYSNIPNILFSIQANSICEADYIQTPAISYKGTWAIQDIIKDLCVNNQVALIDHDGWSGKTLNNQYLYGSFLEKIKKLIHNTRSVFHYIPSLPQNNTHKISQATLEIWGSQTTFNDNNTSSAIVISPETGMINYPTYTASECSFTTIFNPSITFFTPLMLQSPTLSQDHYRNPWQGFWFPTAITHKISSEIPNANWETDVQCWCSLIGKEYVK